MAQTPFERSWYLQGGAYVHYNDDEDYEGPPLFAGIERHISPKYQLGFSMFQNSFGQFTQYAYVGRTFHPWAEHPRWRFKLTAGVIQGYRGERHDTLPIRWSKSWGLGAVPTFGWAGERVGCDVAVLTDAGLLFLVGYRWQ
ncbi:MAG: hypothetical protein AAGA84_08275 [Pseudomonadota bacterium]